MHQIQSHRWQALDARILPSGKTPLGHFQDDEVNVTQARVGATVSLVGPTLRHTVSNRNPNQHAEHDLHQIHRGRNLLFHSGKGTAHRFKSRVILSGYFFCIQVVDEIDRILTVVETTTPAPRTHEILQELRDISSMAMEHFDETILPRLKRRVNKSNCELIGEITRN